VPLAVVVPLLLPLLVCEPGTGLCVLLAVAVPLLLPLLVCKPSTGLCVLLAVAVLLLLPLLVCKPNTGLCLLLAIAVPLLLPLLVCQPGTGLCVLLAVAVPLLLPGCGGHANVVVALHLSSTLRLLEGCLDCSLCIVLLNLPLENSLSLYYVAQWKRIKGPPSNSSLLKDRYSDLSKQTDDVNIVGGRCR
jgi:hypothetical protein